MKGQWLNRGQPQTLINGVILLYINAVLTVLFAFGSPIALALGAAEVAGGYGIANEKKWGYSLGLVAAFAPIVINLALGSLFGPSIFSFVFEVILIVLLLHPQSREYQRIWFK